MDFDETEKRFAGKPFLLGIVVFVAAMASLFFYFSGRDVNVPQTVREFDVAVPTDSATTGQQGPIDPNKAPAVSPRGVPNFAIPTEPSTVATPMPAPAPADAGKDAAKNAD